MGDSPDHESDSDYEPSNGRASRTSSNKNKIESNSQESPHKRQKVHDDRSRLPVAILPAPASTASYPYPNVAQPPSSAAARPRTVLNAKRSSSLNLKNYPSHRHPTGFGIWILQKVEQMHRERRENSPTTAPIFGSQPTYNTPPPAFTPDPVQRQPNVPARTGPYDLKKVKEEIEEMRLQSQRDRKSKQRQENWVKNKENDLVSRAKLEAKKKFDSTIPETERQTWIEERVQDDYDKMMNRLAGQFHTEIAHLGPFQIGFAKHYFNPTTWAAEKIDPQALEAGRLLADVFPGLIENNVSPRSEKAVEDLLRALEISRPSHLAFYEAVRILSENLQVLQGVDAVLAQLFAPRIGAFSLIRSRRALSSELYAKSPTPQPATLPLGLPQGESSQHITETHAPSPGQSNHAPQAYTQHSNVTPYAGLHPVGHGSYYDHAASHSPYPGHAYPPPSYAPMQQRSPPDIHSGYQTPMAAPNHPPPHQGQSYPAQHSSHYQRQLSGTESSSDGAADEIKSHPNGHVAPAENDSKHRPEMPSENAKAESSKRQNGHHLETASNRSLPSHRSHNAEGLSEPGDVFLTASVSGSLEASENGTTGTIMAKHMSSAAEPTSGGLVTDHREAQSRPSAAGTVSEQSSAPVPLDNTSSSQRLPIGRQTELSDSFAASSHSRLQDAQGPKKTALQPIETTPDRSLFVTDESETSPAFPRGHEDHVSDDDEPQLRASRRERKLTAKAQELTKLSSRKKRPLSPQPVQPLSKIVRLSIPSMKKSVQNEDANANLAQSESQKDSDDAKIADLLPKQIVEIPDELLEQEVAASLRDSTTLSRDPEPTIIVAQGHNEAARPHVQIDDAPSIGRASLRSRKSLNRNVEQDHLSGVDERNTASDADSALRSARRTSRRQSRLRRSTLADKGPREVSVETAEVVQVKGSGNVERPAVSTPQEADPQGERNVDSSLLVWASIASEWHDSDADDEDESPEAEERYRRKVVDSLQAYAARKRKIQPAVSAAPKDIADEVNKQRPSQSQWAVQSAPPPTPLSADLPVHSTQSSFGFAPFFQYYGYGPSPPPPQGYWNQSYPSYQPTPNNLGAPNPGYHTVQPQYQGPQQQAQYSYPPRPHYDPYSGYYQQPYQPSQPGRGFSTNYNALTQARSNARSRGIHIYDSMDWETIQSLVDQHDARLRMQIDASRKKSPMVPPKTTADQSRQPQQQPFSPPASQPEPFPTYNRNMPRGSSYGPQPGPPTVASHGHEQPPLKGAPPAFSAAAASRRLEDGLVPLAPAPTVSLQYSPSEDLQFARIDTPRGELKQFRIRRMETPESLAANQQGSATSVQKKPLTGTSKFRVDGGGSRDGEGGSIPSVDGSNDGHVGEGVKDTSFWDRNFASISNGHPSSSGGPKAYRRGGQIMSFGGD